MVDNARKWLVDLGVALVLAGAWWGSAWAGSRGTEIDHQANTWTIPGPSMETATTLIAWIAPVLALVFFVGAIVKRRWVLLGAIVIISSLGLLLTVAVGFLGSTNGASRPEVQAADGHRYVLLASGFQDYIYWLGRVEHDDEWSKVVRPIARSDDFAAPNVRLVRPAGATNTRGGVRTSADGRYVVVEVWEGCASIALDTKSGDVWSSEEFDSGSTIEQLSPFILLDADDKLHPADVEALRGESKCPRSKSLEELNPEQFEHPNPAVRALAPNPSR